MYGNTDIISIYGHSHIVGTYSTPTGADPGFLIRGSWTENICHVKT